MYGSSKHSRRGILSPSWDFMSVSLLVLGIGSFLFHATLRQTLEFVDEFSMIGLAWSMLQASLTFRQPPGRARAISIALAVVYLSFSVFYLQAPLIIYQVYAFTSSLGALLLHTFYVFYWAPYGLPESKLRDWSRRTWKAVAISVVGYLLWIIDFEYCAQLRAMRQHLGLPWAFLLELHGWWHILTAVGASQSMQIAREARAEMNREKSK
jgi:dihydroceramidase